MAPSILKVIVYFWINNTLRPFGKEISSSNYTACKYCQLEVFFKGTYVIIPDDASS
jgi:hypothetical protein